MQQAESVMSKNREHYNRLYGRIGGNAHVEKVRRLNAFLDDAIRTDTSWRGLYYDGFADRLAKTRVLELGSGDGLNALVMAAFGAHVVANDISHETKRILGEATAKLGLDNLEVVVGDFSDIPFEPGSFDFVVGKAFLHHLTHELEDSYLSKVARLLKPTGEARFVEPATNSAILDVLRLMTPVPGRPSILNKKQFLKFKELDPHPDRDNSSAHFIDVGKKFFLDVHIVPFGALERLCRLMPRGAFRRRFRRGAHRAERYLPDWFRWKAARSQLITFVRPRNGTSETRPPSHIGAAVANVAVSTSRA